VYGQAILRLRLDDASGSVASDASGNGLHGTLVNMEEEEARCVL